MEDVRYRRDETDRHSPAKAEESQIEAQQRSDYMSDEGTCLAGVQVESEPEGRCQGKELACHKVYLMREIGLRFASIQ